MNNKFKEIRNTLGLKIVDNYLYLNGDKFSLEGTVPGVDYSKVILFMPYAKHEWKTRTVQELAQRKLDRQLRREERKRQRALRRAEKKHRFLWFRF